jgi:hypothetical protein
MRWSIMEWLRSVLLSKATPPPRVTPEERRAVDDALDHSARARSRSSTTIHQWEQVTASTWGLRRPDA